MAASPVPPPPANTPAPTRPPSRAASRQPELSPELSPRGDRSQLSPQAQGPAAEGEGEGGPPAAACAVTGARLEARVAEARRQRKRSQGAVARSAERLRRMSLRVDIACGRAVGAEAAGHLEVATPTTPSSPSTPLTPLSPNSLHAQTSKSLRQLRKKKSLERKLGSPIRMRRLTKDHRTNSGRLKGTYWAELREVMAENASPGATPRDTVGQWVAEHLREQSQPSRLAQHVHVVQFAGKRQLRLIEINTHHHPEPAPPRELERAVERLQRLGEAA